jgi:hypothetical protein
MKWGGRKTRGITDGVITGERCNRGAVYLQKLWSDKVEAKRQFEIACLGVDRWIGLIVKQV